MKKIFLAIIMVFLSVSLFAEKNKDLDEVIYHVGETIVSSMDRNSIIAILDFSAEKQALGTYISEKLAEDVMDIGGLRLVTRQHTDLIMQELKFQMSGFVSDSTALSICQQLGAQALVFGQIEEFNNNYRLQVKMIDVETSSYIILKNYNIARSQQIERLLGNASKYYKASVGVIAESNLYSLNRVALATGLTFDYAVLKKLSLGLDSRFSYDISENEFGIFTIEPLLFMKLYLVSPSGEPCTGMFLEAQGGMSLINVQDEIKTSYVAAGALGYRFGLNKVYIEPLLRFGYPFIVGAGISAGVRL